MGKNKLYEGRVHYNYTYRFNTLFKKQKYYYEWIIKKYENKKFYKNLSEELKNFDSFLDIEKYKIISRDLQNYIEELKNINSDIEIEKNLHPFRLKKIEFRKEYIEILTLFLSNYYSITSQNILQIEKISRQLCISSCDLDKFIKKAHKENKMDIEKFIEYILLKIKKMKFTEKEIRILKLDFMIFNFYQNSQMNYFEKKILGGLETNKIEIRYFKKEIIKNLEVSNEKRLVKIYQN
jgi:hypothetical protein